MTSKLKFPGMKKAVVLLFAVVLAVNVSTAQTIADGIKLLNYGKNKSAADGLKKIYDANSKDPQNIYWYGQALLAQDDVKGAKALYQKALQEGVNDPFVLVGMGHVELLEGGDLNSAKQKFEQAITMSTETKGKNKNKPNASVLNAIGRANADGGSKIGDPVYAIDKLKQAAALDLTNPDIYINIGVNYLKLGGENGGEAVKAYQEALTRDPKNARAMYSIGKIYQSQNNPDVFNQHYTSAITADPTFAPVYYSLYNYYSNRDVNKAKENLEKYVQYADKECATDYLYADYLFRAGKYQESLEKAKAMETGECKTYYQTPLLFVYNYDRLGDSIQAKSYVEKYFASVPKNKIVADNYDIAVRVLSKIAGSEQTAIDYLKLAIAGDTSVNNKSVYMNQIADLYGKLKNSTEQINWLQQSIQLKGGSMTEADYYKISDNLLKAKDYAGAMAFSQKYMQAFPTKPQPYYFNVRAAKALDTTSNPGIAVEALNQQNDYLAKDSIVANVEKNKKLIFNNYYYLLKYYNDVAKDVPKAIEITDKMLALYPNVGGEENTFATQTKDALIKSTKPQPAAQKPAPKAPPTKKPGK